MNGNLGAEACLTGDGTKLNSVIGDLTDLHLEETADEVGMTARENDLGATGAVLNGYNVGPDAVADIVLLCADALARRHDPLELAEIQDNITTVKTTHGATNDLACTILELLVDHLLLNLSDTLRNCLTGRLGGDTSKVTRGHLDLDLFADCDLIIDQAGLGQGNFFLRISNGLNDQRLGKSTDRSALGIDVDANLAGAGKALLGCGNEGRGDRLDEDLTFDTFFALEVVEHGDKFGVHGSSNSRLTGQEGFQDSVSGVCNYGGTMPSGQLKESRQGNTD